MKEEGSPETIAEKIMMEDMEKDQEKTGKPASEPEDPLDDPDIVQMNVEIPRKLKMTLKIEAAEVGMKLKRWVAYKLNDPVAASRKLNQARK